MASVSGVNFRFQVNTGTDVSPIYTSFAGGRGATLTMDVDEVDVTTKDSSQWHQGLPNIRSSEGIISSLYGHCIPASNAPLRVANNLDPVVGR